jgi:hypothetical protein
MAATHTITNPRFVGKKKTFFINAVSPDFALEAPLIL